MTLESWLTLHAVEGDTVLSWVNDHHRGYAYPEAAGLLVRWFALRGLHPPEAVVRRLRDEVESRRIGRDGHTYAFDTAVVLAGLEALDDHEDPRWTSARAALPGMGIVDPPAKPRWSTTCGPHMLKLAVGSAARAARGWSTPALAWLADLRVEQDARGRIATPPHAQSYMHAHAYATEGLMALASLGLHGRASLDGAVEYLRHVQRDDGGIPAWSDGGPTRADATAQAVRLFILHERGAHADAIERGLDCLRGLCNEHGAVVYEPGSGDHNTWCSLFAAQARAWAHGDPARVEALL
ncbi:MAG: hypothetical protein ACE37F_08040 [Nannocystaceae bacterium]|nr:hypothetical protein [bacterium]